MMITDDVTEDVRIEKTMIRNLLFFKLKTFFSKKLSGNNTVLLSL